MPIAEDTRTGLFKFMKALPHNAFGVWIIRQLSKAPSAKLPDRYVSEWIEIPRPTNKGSIHTMVVAPKERDGPLPLVVHYHGGGHLFGTPQGSSLDRVVNFIAAQDAIFVIPDYTLASDAPFPAGFDDCYETLLWAAQNAERLGGRADQIIIGGESAGGGITLSVALKARDEGRVNIAFQFPIYPMCDDRSENWTKLPPGDVSWSRKLNVIGWDKLLGPGRRGAGNVTGYEAPARAKDLSGLPPTFSYIGTLDLFLDENREMFRRMKAAGVKVDYTEFEDVYHGQENFAPEHATSLRIKAHYRDTFKAFVEKYSATQP